MPKPVKTPEFKTFFAPPKTDDISGHLHRQTVGALGFLLPLTLWCINLIRPTTDMEPVKPWDSISSYFYSGGGPVFTGVLFALSVFMVTYRGYNNTSNKWDRILGVWAAIAAFCVAFFPTKSPLKMDVKNFLPSPPWVNDPTFIGQIHLISACALFTSFIAFSFIVFRSPKNLLSVFKFPKDGRDRLFYIAGILLAIFVLWAFIAGQSSQEIFWPESLALMTFGVSWLAKGKIDWTYQHLKRRLFH